MQDPADTIYLYIYIYISENKKKVYKNIKWLQGKEAVHKVMQDFIEEDLIELY